jgi:hypothetical protein
VTPEARRRVVVGGASQRHKSTEVTNLWIGPGFSPIYRLAKPIVRLLYRAVIPERPFAVGVESRHCLRLLWRLAE